MYKLKYHTQFVSLDGKLNQLSLWQNTEMEIAPEEVALDDMPFSVEMPELESKHQVIRGTGCELNLLSDTNMRFFNGLYHVDKKEFIVKHFIDGILNWVGFLNSEMNRESYSDSFNYPVQVTGNDGFALMDRIQFLDDNGARITGVGSKFDIISLIFNKIGLPFTELRINLSTTFAEYSGAVNSTILHESFVDLANFYDEDGEAMTLRRVLEAVLKPYGAFITQTAGNITIQDVHAQATGEPITFKRYSCTTWQYISDVVINPLKSLVSIGYMGTGSEAERSGGKNKQVVSYSPYPLTAYLTKTISDLAEFGSVAPAWSTKDNYLYKTLLNNKYWDGLFEVSKYSSDVISHFANKTLFPAFGVNNITYIADDTAKHYRWNDFTYVFVDSSILWGSKENIHARIPYSATNVLSLKYTGNAALVLGKSEYSGTVNATDGTGLLIKGTIGHISRPFRDLGGSGTLNMAYVSYFYLNIKISIGEYFYNGVSWDTVDTFYRARISTKDSTRFGQCLTSDYDPKSLNADVNMISLGNNGVDGIFIPANIDLSGILNVEIWSDLGVDIKDQAGRITGYQNNYQYTHEAWISNIDIQVTSDSAEELPDSDVEYIGYLDQRMKDEAEKVELICGTDVTKADRGKILYSAAGIYKPVKQWTRANQTYKIEELLLNSLSSNYRAGYLTLNNLKLRNAFDQLSVITDEAILPGVKFMVKSSTVNYRDNLIECSLVEISPDELTIVK